VTSKGPGWGELAKLVADHLLSDKDRHVLPAVVDGDGMANHSREDGAGPGPGANHGSLIGAVQDIDLLLKFGVDVRTLLR
jgi:hypothetical protein